MMSGNQYKFLFYVTLSYSYPILRPIEVELKKRGYVVAWFVRKGTEAENYVRSSDEVLHDVAEIKTFAPDAVFVPGNSVPSFFPGIKVQVFHGFDSGKKNKFKIRGYFDLYCTQGPKTTEGFLAERAALKNPTFDIVETGWPKLDTIFTRQPETDSLKTESSQILYAPTFSPALTSTYALLNEIQRLSEKRDWVWRVKFHPKVTAEEMAMYKAIENKNLQVIETDAVIPLLQSADVLLSDTSSILSEFSLLNKSVVSFNNRSPESWMINVTEVEQLEAGLVRALKPDTNLLRSISEHSKYVHPYQDGLSSQRVVDAVEAMIESGTSHLKNKPLNLFRNLKMRIKLGYYGL